MTRREVRSQTELDQALADGAIPVCVGDGHFRIRESSRVVARESSSVEAWGSSRVEARESSRVEAWGSSRVEAWGSSRVEARGSSRVEAWGSSRVEAWGSSSVEAWGSSRVEAWGSSRVEARESSRVEARESSSVKAGGSSSVEAWGSSRVEARESSRVEAWGSSRVEARGSSSVKAGGYVAVQRHHGHNGEVSGGVVIALPDPNDLSASDWCEFHGVTVDDGHALLYKALDDGWRSGHGTAYRPGSTVEAPDYEPGRYCGNGLHFGVTPRHARIYHSAATRYVACLVPLDTLVPLDDKAKARSCDVLYEVDADGDRIDVEGVAA